MYAAKQSEINSKSLCEELEKFKESRKNKYVYDKSIHPTKIFTFMEDLTLLHLLRTWIKKEKSICRCTLCSMKKLLYIAYDFA